MSDNPTQDVLDNPAAPVGDVNVDAGDKSSAPAGSKQWFDDLDADLKSNPSVIKFKSPADLAKSYINLEKTLGKGRVVVPTEKSTPEEWRAFFKAGGAPEKEDEYDVGMEDLPEQARTPAEQLAALRKAALDNGVSKKAWDGIFKAYKDGANARLNQEVESIKKMRETSETELRQEWGAAYDGKVQNAQKVIDKFFKENGVRKEFSILANDKGFIKAMAAIADQLGEDAIVGRAKLTMTPDEAQAEIAKMLGDRKSPFFDDLHPEHQAYKDKYNSLVEMAG